MTMTTTYPHLPFAVRLGGRDWTIEKAWPPRGKDHRLSLELRSRGTLRAGYADPDGTVTLLDPDADPALPSLARVARHGQLVAHRPGRRAVVRLDSGRGYAKVVRPGRADELRRAHAKGRGFAAGFAIPNLAPPSFPTEDVVCFQALPGRPLSQLGEDAAVSDAVWESAWSSWERGWITAMTSPVADTLPVHDADDEKLIVRTWARHAAAQLGGDDRILHAAQQIVDRLWVAGGASALAHRDLHDGQMIWDAEGGMGLIDLDTCVRADPALDLGNLAAHVDFAVRQHRWSAERGRTARSAIVRTATALGVDAARLSAWQLAAQFRVSCVNVLRPRWRNAARAELMRITEERIDDACET